MTPSIHPERFDHCLRYYTGSPENEQGRSTPFRVVPEVFGLIGSSAEASPPPVPQSNPPDLLSIYPMSSGTPAASPQRPHCPV